MHSVHLARPAARPHRPSRMVFSRALSPEGTSSVAIGLSAGITSTVLTGFAPLSDLGRGIVFLGSALSGAMFAYWSARASSMAAAFGKSALGGALQANIS